MTPYDASIKKAGLVAFLVVLFTGFAFGQSSSLAGSVLDPQGNMISGATVTATNLATGAVRTTTSSRDGSYQLAQLAPGAYRVRAEAQGFAAVVLEAVQVLVSTNLTANISFTKIGAVSDTVTVQGGESILNTSDATVGNTFNEKQIRQLPLEGRNVAGLLAAQPGVVFIGNTNADGGTTDQRNGSVNGGKSDQANVTLDGVDVNDQQNGFAFNSVLRVTLDSVQEFRVTTTNANADQGRSSGAQVSLITKSGANKFSGSLYEFHRNTVTSANDWFNNAAGVGRQKLIRNIFGGTVGGPIVKDKFFFFLNYEGRRDRREDSVARVVPSAEFRNGIIKYNNTTGAVTSLTPDQVKALDPAGIGANTAALALFKQYPLPNDTTVGDGLNFLGYRFKAPIALDWDTYIARFDYNLSTRHLLFIRGNLQNDSDTTLPLFPGQQPQFTNLNNSKGLAAGHTWQISNSITNMFRYGYTRQGLEASGASTQVYVTFRNLTPILPTAARSNGRITPVHNYVDDLTWIKGAHSFGFGANVRFIRNARFNFANSFPSASANASWLLGTGRDLRPADIGGGAVAFSDSMMALLGIISQGNAVYNFDRTGKTLGVGEAVRRRFGADEYEFYGQDSWRMRPNLTFTLGLRYGLYSPPFETEGNQVAPNIRLGDWFNLRGLNGNKGIPSNAAPAISYELSGPVNGGRGFYDWDYNNFAPRFAFAYSPKFENSFMKKLFGESGKSAVRGGFSLAYDRIGGGLAVTFDQAGSFGLSTALVNASSSLTARTAPRFTGFNSIPAGILPPLPAGSNVFPKKFPGKGERGSFAITFGLDDNIRTPYSMAFNFSIQRELPHNQSLELGYVGRFGRKLLIQGDLAQPVNLMDSVSSTFYYDAAKQLIGLSGKPIGSIPKIPFWENVFGSSLAGITAGDMDDFYGDFTRVNPGISAGTVLSATQIAYYLYNQTYAPDYTSALYDLDLGFGSKFGTYAFFNDQFSALAAWRSVAPSNYNGLQAVYRKRFSKGLQFDVNYTLSKSFDWSSGAERSGSFGGGFIFNSWDPGQRYAVSDFDIRHSINANYIWELPLGKGRAIGGGVNSVGDAIIGGWQFSGIYRWTSGLPVGVGNGRFWPTNWNLTGFASRIGSLPALKTTKNAAAAAAGGAPGPNLFPDPANAIKSYDYTLVGESGERNGLRGDGFFGIDIGLGKTWKMPFEGHTLQFRWETFNLTNSVRFDVNSTTLDLGSGRANFGKYSTSLTQPRVMQFALRYEF
ncbi:MAG: carboxypeptidase regulatory-like domain-containing protein [Blastocatellia bacterium]